MQQPIVCIDLDGTLIDHQGLIHPKDIEILNSGLDLTLVVATGRSLESVRKSFYLHHIDVEPTIPFPLVLLNGTLVFRQNEQFLQYHPFNYSIQEKIIGFVHEFPKVTSLFLDIREIQQLNATPFSQGLIRLFDFETKPFITNQGRYSFSKVMCISENHDLLKKINQKLQNLELELAFSMDSVLEITPMGINKASGLLALIESQGWNKSTIIAVGNGENDFPLFEKAQICFAPSTSPLTIQSRVDYIIDPLEAGILSPVLSMIYSCD